MTAVEWCGRQLTHAQVESAVGALAERLAPLGVARSCVLVMGPLSPAYVIGLLAAWRAGAVPVPVDAGLSRDQYAWLDRRTCPAVVISSDVTPVDQYRGATAGTAEIVLDAGTGEVVVDSLPDVPRRARVFRDADAGYVIPTSGSTGEPKAVVGSYRGLSSFLAWFREEFALDATDRCAAVTRVNFDPSLRELLGVLGAGGTLSLPPVDAQLDFSALAGHFIDSAPTTAFLVPSIAMRLAGELRSADAQLTDLRLVFFAGETLGRRVVEEWAAIAPNAEIVNLYGQTEATLAQLYRRHVQRFEHGAEEATPVGRVRPGIEVTIDEPDGEGIGEVLLTADAPALGVLGAAAGDAPGAHDVVPFAVPLRTGDLGYRGADGDIVLVGRCGNDIKFAGRRVSFHGFIDAVEALDGVGQCVVVDREGPQIFVAAAPHDFAAAPHDDAAAEGLRAAVHRIGREKHLPRFALHVRAQLPMLRSGKVDRRALIASADLLASAPAATDPAAGDAEPAGIEQVLRAALGCEGDDATGFAEAGVSSLDMAVAVAKIRRRYGLRLTVQECFALRDVAALAREIEKRQHVAVPVADGETAGGAAGPGTPYPLSTRQVGYMWVCMADGNANWCNLSREIRFDRRHAAAEVEQALHTLLRRHDALALALTPGGDRQTFTDPGELTCPVRAVATDDPVDSAEFRARLQAERGALVAELIDPTAPPPLRAVLVAGADGCSVVLAVHHLFVDGLGLDVLAGELTALLTGRGLEPAGPPDGYRDYCVATARTELPHAAADYWRQLLDGVTQFRLPEATGSDAAQGELVSKPLGALCTRAVHRIAEDLGVSAFTVVLAAFERAVAETFGVDRPPVIVVGQHRGDSPADVVGNFTTTLVVRTPGAGSLRHDIAAVARQLADGAAHSDWEFDQRVTDLGLTGADCFPLSTVLFNQRPMPRDLRARDLGDWQPRALGRGLRYQLQGELQMSGREMVVGYYYRKGISGDGVIERVHRVLLWTIRAGQEALHD
ncbi:AMP-binding protein [Streptomyces sp. NPDC059002]|uniref:AMP-binding protein n=1 Tax=Streptomyces sp. NPDC059002 TaxID=3346690 RepID=UPI00369CF0FF